MTENKNIIYTEFSYGKTEWYQMISRLLKADVPAEEIVSCLGIVCEELNEGNHVCVGRHPVTKEISISVSDPKKGEASVKLFISDAPKSSATYSGFYPDKRLN